MRKSLLAVTVVVAGIFIAANAQALLSPSYQTTANGYQYYQVWASNKYCGNSGTPYSNQLCEQMGLSGSCSVSYGGDAAHPYQKNIAIRIPYSCTLYDSVYKYTCGFYGCNWQLYATYPPQTINAH